MLHNKSHRTRTKRRLLQEQLEPRAMFHAEAAWDNAAALTLSFAPDGAAIGSQTSDLSATLDQFGAGNWQDAVYRAFQTWAQYANVNVGVVPDRGDPFGAPEFDVTGRRFGDIRIGAVPMSLDTLAVSVPHDEGVAGSWSGDILFNSLGHFTSVDDVFKVALHEAGHVLGMEHSVDPLSPMFRHDASVQAVPTAGDIAALRALYGPRTADRNETQDSNNTQKDATSIGLSQASDGYDGSTPTIAYGAISTATDVDYYELSMQSGYSGPVTFQVVTSGLSLLAPKLTVYDRKGAVMGQATATGHVGATLSVTLPSTSDSKYYARVEGAPGSGPFGLGGYALVGSFVQKQTVTADQVARVVDEGFRLVGFDNKAIDDQDIRAMFAGGPLPELNDDLHADDDVIAATALAPMVASQTLTRYQAVATVNDATDHDFYKIMSAEANGQQWLTVSLESLTSGGLIPQVTVRDRNGNGLPAIVHANGAGAYVVEVAGIETGRQYVLEVASAGALPSYQSGNYKLTATFTFAADAATLFAAGELSTAAPATRHALYVGQSQLFSLLLSTQSATDTGMAWVVIYDQQQRPVYSLTAPVGMDRSATSVLLDPGEYSVEFGASADAVGDGNVTYALSGAAVSHPMGPPLIDTTTTPIYACTGTPGSYCYPGSVPTTQAFIVGSSQVTSPRSTTTTNTPPSTPDAGYWTSNNSATNVARPTDTNNDGVVTALDAVLVINYLNAVGPQSVPAPPAVMPNYLDVNGDGTISALDALLVIIRLNSVGSGKGEASAEPVATAPSVASSPVWTAREMALMAWDQLVPSKSKTPV
jgi:hypothetical protein